ncbi:MAG: hypothetical protein KDI43_13015 [Gammaproteobacteria bacterium]|nr:hypothetical protein [Gammaproteobacteria bacterium]MCP5407195.1 hypothetical protein [Chromatiaceae bacterium]MCP5408247.1 hypothetical protein [Chromatiaceae bacterium]MCP5442061.1 hypothetical protein [Chromatiaceae bacterium]
MDLEGEPVGSLYGCIKESAFLTALSVIVTNDITKSTTKYQSFGEMIIMTVAVNPIMAVVTAVSVVPVVIVVRAPVWLPVRAVIMTAIMLIMVCPEIV